MADYWVSTVEIQVSYADTDMMGVIYHANYLKWFELGRTQINKDIGLDYLDMEKAGYCVPVCDLSISYKKAVYYGDQVFVKTWIEENGGVRTTYGYQVVNGKGELCAEGFSRHFVVRKDDFKPVRFKKVFPAWFEKFEEIKKKDKKD